jgi:hypothetical protein
MALHTIQIWTSNQSQLQPFPHTTQVPQVNINNPQKALETNISSNSPNTNL